MRDTMEDRTKRWKKRHTDETKTQTVDDAEERKVIEVESGAMVTSKGTSCSLLMLFLSVRQ